MPKCFLPGSLTKLLYTFLITPAYSTCAAHEILLHCLTLIYGEVYKL